MWVALAFAAAFLAGVVLAVKGVGGRRIGHAPRCRRCSFDLAGIPHQNARCPECGSELSPQSILYGVRRRRWGPVFIAILLMLPGAAAITELCVQSVAEINWIRLTPAWILESRLESAQPPEFDAALGELTARLTSGSLDPGRANRILDVILDHQANASIPWDWPRTQYAVAAWPTATPAQRWRLIRQGLEARLWIPQHLRAGEDFHISVEVRRERLLEQIAIQPDIQLQQFLINGLPLDSTPVDQHSSDVLSVLASSEGLTPGKYEIAATYSIRIRSEDLPPQSFDVHLSMSLYLLSRGPEPYAIGGDPQWHRYYVPRVRLKHLAVSMWPLAESPVPVPGPMVHMNVGLARVREDQSDAPPGTPDRLELAIIARAEGREWPIGAISPENDQGVMLLTHGFLPGYAGGRLQIILRPTDPEIRRSMGDLIAGEYRLDEVSPSGP